MKRFISGYFSYLLTESPTSFEYPGNQACKFKFLCFTVILQCIPSCIFFNRFFLRACRGSIMFPLYIVLFSIVSLCVVSLKGLFAIEQLIHILNILIFVFSISLLNTRLCLVSVLSWFRDKNFDYTQCTILSSEFSIFFSFLITKHLFGLDAYKEIWVHFCVHHVKIKFQKSNFSRKKSQWCNHSQFISGIKYEFWQFLFRP